MSNKPPKKNAPPPPKKNAGVILLEAICFIASLPTLPKKKDVTKK